MKTDMENQSEPNTPDDAVVDETTLAELLGSGEVIQEKPLTSSEDELRAVVEAVIYVTEEPLTLDQIATSLREEKDKVARVLEALTQEYAKSDRGLTIREIAGGYKMGTKPEHHETIKQFVKNLKPPLKLSLAALETLAVIAYKQPITAPEIMEIRGVQGGSALKTLVDRKLVTTAGRKNVVGKPMLYKTTREFLVQFGLKDLAELPTLKEFEELRRLAISDEDILLDEEAPPELPLLDQAEAAPPPEKAE
jgi:segregation and condensation protein B